MVRAIKIPVIAAGGIADAKGVAAAMALGAAGVQVGTSYMLCPEATTSTVHRAALTSEAARLTAVTNLFTGRPARGIVNRIVRELGPINAAAPRFPLAASAIAPLRQRPRAWALATSHHCGPARIPAAVGKSRHISLRASWPTPANLQFQPMCNDVPPLRVWRVQSLGITRLSQKVIRLLGRSDKPAYSRNLDWPTCLRRSPPPQKP